MGRDHSIECEVCGEMRGGFDDLLCDCFIEEDLERMRIREHIQRLSHNLAIAAALCRAFDLGEDSYIYATGFGELTWRPGCGNPAPKTRAGER